MSEHDIPPSVSHPRECRCFLCYCLKLQAMRRSRGKRIGRISLKTLLVR